MEDSPRANEARRIGGLAVALRRSHPHAPALDVLDLVFEGGGGVGCDFSCTASDGRALVHPRGAFGQLIAEAFDRGMTPAEWMQLTGPSAAPELVEALDRIWATYVVPRFGSRFGVRLTGPG
jgi:hypothetical protein